MLLQFLAQLVGRYPFLKYIIIEILDHIDEFEDHLDLLPDIFHTREVLAMYASAHLPEKAFNYVEELHKSEKPLTKRLNATIGIILGELICKSTSRDPLAMAREFWKPTQLGHPSSLEQIALAYLNDTNSVLQPIFKSSKLEIQTLTGFIHSKKRLFDSAKHILKGLLPDLASQYGPKSMTFGLAVSEYVKCCNLTEDMADGEYWARYALFNRLDTSGAKPSADTLYLQVALADSLLAASKYESAIVILSDILQDAQSSQPSIVIMVSARLCKARRRLGDPFPSRQMVTALPQDMRALGHVSKSLRLIYAEEIGCNLDSMDTVRSSGGNYMTVLQSLSSSPHPYRTSKK
ncbi:hypothetical protein NA56DRAFT_119775 [Hyaloscypha hepaticicola]|uniref:Anaphase-promoting complex subunit 5 n=1 Tax=Hyaloscypha hepaticicola TaxID=2082293 RepID=A0A2J6Q5V5_9HELO|nr:hypothetical protein NA56DRAFT_119775 [Hyaloscypha hepaticicola]